MVALVLASSALWIRGSSPEEKWAAIEAAIANRHWSGAESRLSSWLRVHPEDGKAWLRLGGVLAFEGRDAEADVAFQRIKDSDPAWSIAQTLIGENAIKHQNPLGGPR